MCLITSILMCVLLYKTEENIGEVLDETYKGEPDF